MEEKLIFTEEEKKKVEELCNELRPKIADSLQPDDETKLKTTIEGSINSGLITRDAFGFNPFRRGFADSEDCHRRYRIAARRRYRHSALCACIVFQRFYR